MAVAWRIVVFFGLIWHGGGVLQLVVSWLVVACLSLVGNFYCFSCGGSFISFAYIKINVL